MLHAPGFKSLLLDPLSLSQNGLSAPEVNIGRRDVVQALVISLVIVVIDEGFDLV
jgi:hypothetical protein